MFRDVLDYVRDGYVFVEMTISYHVAVAAINLACGIVLATIPFCGPEALADARELLDHSETVLAEMAMDFEEWKAAWDED